MSYLRKLERQVIRSKCYKKNGNTKQFADSWKEYRISKYGEKNVPVDTMPKKKRFFDVKDNLINALHFRKMQVQELIANMKAEKESAAESTNN